MSNPSVAASQPATAAVGDRRIVRAAIHPGIGIARVGNSADAFFLAPQVVDPPPAPVGFYRDPVGALKREACEFRVYGYNAAGEVVAEIDARTAQLEWSVHVANRKAQWFQWQIAMDIPEAAATVLPLRNAKVTARDDLAIDAGAQTIRGCDSAPVLCSGSFDGVSVKLGELRTDARGRLLFLGGHGVSASPTGTPIFIPSDGDSFINADGWYDDTCDGTVDCAVTIDGAAIPVESAWVVTAPPNYAPQVKAERTLYDLLADLYIQAGWMQAPAALSFTRDIYPILQRLTGLQWCNQGFATLFGHGGRYDFGDPGFVAQLCALPPAGAYDPNEELRRQVFNSFRPPSPSDANQLPWPWLYGDAMEVPAGDSPRQNASISQTQYATLQSWVEGKFAPDIGDPALRPPPHIDQVPLAQQPATLDRAALEFCLADAFHPGCELTWPMRHLSLYSAPFRIRRRPVGSVPPDYGTTLDQTQALAATGPLHAQGPGDLNRWMGLPWQADTAYCRAGYQDSYDPYAPTFWPARVPNHVLTGASYAIVMDASQPLAARIDAFSQRTDWNQPLHGTTAQQMEQMVQVFGSMGLLEVQPGPVDQPQFPAQMMVAAFGPQIASSAAGGVKAVTAEAVRVDTAAADTAPLLKARRRALTANFDSPEEASQAPLPVRIRRAR